MCDDAGHGPALGSLPRPASGPAVDPITLDPADEVTVTTLVDNVYDALLEGNDLTRRTPFTVGSVRAPQFDGGSTTVGLRAEHGFSALVSVRRGSTTTQLLFDTGLSPDAMVTNADRIGIDLAQVQAVIMSHGHFDHAGGLAGLAERGTRTVPMVLHPNVWTPRRMAVPGNPSYELPTLSRRALLAEGFDVIERRQPSLLVDGSVLITGEIDRTTDFEHGMPPTHLAWTGSSWEPDPLIIDDQALVVHLRGQGLIVLTGCGHAGAINIVRHAQRLTGIDQLHALIGGLHLSGSVFEPVIAPTVAALQAAQPHLLIPGHCTGWKAQHALAAALPDAWIPSSAGSSYHLTAA
jgi:7,8-dihydropterin-6-yl-methyl-4-(beta-D-ribofuranosyl)aminobenzene 5'-phosphate synthase